MRSKTHKRSLIRQLWHGRTLLILALLFLASPNALADNPGAGCPLFTTVNAAPDNCFTVTPPVGVITVDAVLTGIEWNAAISKNITGPPQARIRFRRNGANLVFLISVNDTSNNTSDSIQLSFDPLHDHISTTDDVTFTIRREGTGHLKTTSGGTVAWVPGANLATCTDTCTTPDFVNGWQAEVVITPADLGLPDLSAIVGFTLSVNNQDTADISTWPEPAPASAATFANIKTRFPIEFMIVLDQSGSMLSQSKWDLAKSATNYLAKTMAIVGEPAYFLDRVGVTTFAWNNGTNTNQTTTPKTLAAPPAFAAGDFVPDPPVITPLPQNYTPLGKGLVEAFTQLGIGVEDTQRVVLFMSDGLHNRPSPSEVPLLPSHLTYRACMAPGAWSACSNSVIRVDTVALGTDGGVDTDLLNKFKNGFSGECFGGGVNCDAATYNITTNSDDLKRFFIQSLDSLYQLNFIADGLANTTFAVNAGERRLIVISSWSAGAPGAFTLEFSNDGGMNWTPQTCSGGSGASAAVGMAFCAVNAPPAGVATQYRAVGNATATRLFALVDLKLRARFSVDQVVHGTGQDLVLRAALNEAGVPVTHDPATHAVKVTVSIKRPTEGFGTYVSTHDPTNCAVVTPTPPPLRQRDPGSAGGSRIDFSLTAAGILAAATGPDVKPPRFGRIDTLFDKCGKANLNVIEDPGLELFDDATHGDVTANDGIYTLRFLNTEFEGSYVLNFKAAGKSPAGSDFSRIKTIAEYVRINVDPGNTPISARDVQQVGNIVTREYYVIPRDRFGGYLGPGYPDQIVFTTTAGSFTTPVIDYNNGVYSQVLQFDRSTENPVVTGTVQGNPVGSFGGGGKGFEFFPYLGGSVYDNSLGLNNGFTLGARVGYRFPNQFALEFESGLTFTKFNTGPNTGRSAKLIQVLGNVRYDIDQWGTANWTPYVITGAGGVFLNGAGSNDSAFAFHGGFGSTWRLTNRVGLRADGRVFRFGSFNGAGSTSSFQFNGGVVFRF